MLPLMTQNIGSTMAVSAVAPPHDVLQWGQSEGLYRAKAHASVDSMN